MADHKHGTMNTSSQEQTFNGFVAFVARSIVVIIVALILIALING